MMINAYHPWMRSMGDSTSMDSSNLQIAVLSGKGGTGKTLVSVNLAAAAKRALYLDCDVEEPNGHLFFKPTWLQSEKVNVKIPVVNNDRCTGCRRCVDFCKFNALAFILDRLLVFQEVCHSCGGCALVCPQRALSEEDHMIGEIREGRSKQVTVVSGVMNIGEESGIPIIKKMLAGHRGEEGLTCIDCPPGSACIVMESIKDADYCLLVAEPTTFGAHNLGMVHELVELMQKPYGVVLNKCLEGENPSESYCLEHDVPILARIPFDFELGRLNADGKIAVRERDDYQSLFSTLLETVKKEVGHETTIDSKR